MPPRPLTAEEEAADSERKKAIEEEIRVMEAAANEPEPPAKGGKKGKGAKQDKKDPGSD